MVGVSERLFITLSLLCNKLFGAASVMEGNMCHSPRGFHPCECLWEVPSGTIVETYREALGKVSLRLHYPNKTMEEKDACLRKPSPDYAARHPSAAFRGHMAHFPSAAKSDPCTLGYAHAAPLEAFYYAPEGVNITSFEAQYVVPEAPLSVESNILYYWIGLQDRGSAENPVLQPVLSFVPNASANNWYFESWNCCPAGHKLKSKSVPVTGPGEVLHGSMSQGRGGDWAIRSANAAGEASVLYSDDANTGVVAAWDWLDIVLETYSVKTCSQYSAGGTMGFERMTVSTADGRTLLPANWSYRPYIDGRYLSPAEAAQFAACCDGSFLVDWPSATMSQNEPLSGDISLRLTKRSRTASGTAGPWASWKTVARWVYSRALLPFFRLAFGGSFGRN